MTTDICHRNLRILLGLRSMSVVYGSVLGWWYEGKWRRRPLINGAGGHTRQAPSRKRVLATCLGRVSLQDAYIQPKSLRSRLPIVLTPTIISGTIYVRNIQNSCMCLPMKWPYETKLNCPIIQQAWLRSSPKGFAQNFVTWHEHLYLYHYQISEIKWAE